MSNPMATPLPWDLVSSAYAEEIVPVFEDYARDALRLAQTPAGAPVVDVACGPGTLGMLAAQAGHPVEALDFSPQMIEKLDARKRRLGIKTLNARLGDGQKLPYADATFGGGFSMFGLMFFPDRAQGYRELRRVLKPGARAVVSSWQRLEDNPMLSARFGALREAMGKALGPNAPKPGAQEMPLVTEQQCKDEMAEAFGDVEVVAISHSQTATSAEDIWFSIERTMAPLVLMRKTVGEERWAPLSNAARDAVVAAVGNGPPVMTLPAWLTVGVAS
ncbi:methyltransferase domain-containing protein [soil metagenome]